MDGWTVRLLAGITLTLAGAAAGRVMAQVKKRRAEQLKSLCQALDKLALAILDRGEPLSRALLSAQSESFKEVSLLMENEMSALDAWREALVKLRAKTGALCALEDGDVEAMTALFSRLGKSYAAEQKLLLDDSRESLRDLYQAARKKADEQGRLYSTLGLLSGLAVAIMLI